MITEFINENCFQNLPLQPLETQRQENETTKLKYWSQELQQLSESIKLQSADCKAKALSCKNNRQRIFRCSIPRKLFVKCRKIPAKSAKRKMAA